MSIGNHELVQHEENNAERLVEEFIKEHQDEFDEFLKEHIRYYTDALADDFCVEHEEWGKFVLDDWTNAQGE